MGKVIKSALPFTPSQAFTAGHAHSSLAYCIPTHACWVRMISAEHSNLVNTHTHGHHDSPYDLSEVTDSREAQTMHM